MLECKNLSCIRNNNILFKKFSFKARFKSKILIIGPNGSGKTTLIRSLSGLLRPLSGNIMYCGKNIYDDLRFYVTSMVYIGHKNACKNSLTVYENIEYWAEIRNTKELIMPAICHFNLDSISKIKYAELSLGWKRRVSLARLLISNANVWLIDEPFCNLDSVTCELVLNLMLARSKQNGVVIITGHTPLNEKYGFKIINLTLLACNG